MNLNGVTFSNLTEYQIQDLKSLETKLNAGQSNSQETILIAYTKSK